MKTITKITNEFAMQLLESVPPVYQGGDQYYEIFQCGEIADHIHNLKKDIDVPVYATVVRMRDTCPPHLKDKRMEVDVYYLMGNRRQIHKRTKWLDCGCCGVGFQIWQSYKDQGQDVDYGICNECQKDAYGHEVTAMDECIEMVQGSLKPKNLEKFNGMERWRQEVTVHQLIESGAIKFSIGGK